MNLSSIKSFDMSDPPPIPDVKRWRFERAWDAHEEQTEAEMAMREFATVIYPLPDGKRVNTTEEKAYGTNAPKTQPGMTIYQSAVALENWANCMRSR